MDSTNFQATIVQSIVDSVKQDHYNFLYTIFHKFGHIGNFSFQDLLKQYPFKQINLYKIDSINSIIQPKIQIINNQCMARCWGQGSYKIQFDRENNKWYIGSYITYYPNTNKWLYGTQCKRNANNNSQYCGIHLNQLNSDSFCLTHGRIDQEPPHPHYDKYRRKILMHIAINKKNNL